MILLRPNYSNVVHNSPFSVGTVSVTLKRKFALYGVSLFLICALQPPQKVFQCV